MEAILEERRLLEDPSYVGQSSKILKKIDDHFEALLLHWAQFVAADVQSKDFLEDEGIRAEFQNSVEEFRKEATIALEKVGEEASKIIDVARDSAKKIEDRARQTAAHISVKEAQKQFEEAQKDHQKQMKFWGALSAGFISLFMIL
jgi:hypothetical protein